MIDTPTPRPSLVTTQCRDPSWTSWQGTYRKTTKQRVVWTLGQGFPCLWVVYGLFMSCCPQLHPKIVHTVAERCHQQITSYLMVWDSDTIPRWLDFYFSGWYERNHFFLLSPLYFARKWLIHLLYMYRNQIILRTPSAVCGCGLWWTKPMCVLLRFYFHLPSILPWIFSNMGCPNPRCYYHFPFSDCIFWGKNLVGTNPNLMLLVHVPNAQCISMYPILSPYVPPSWLVFSPGSRLQVTLEVGHDGHGWLESPWKIPWVPGGCLMGMRSTNSSMFSIAILLDYQRMYFRISEQCFQVSIVSTCIWRQWSFRGSPTAWLVFSTQTCWRSKEVQGGPFLDFLWFLHGVPQQPENLRSISSLPH